MLSLAVNESLSSIFICMYLSEQMWVRCPQQIANIPRMVAQVFKAVHLLCLSSQMNSEQWGLLSFMSTIISFVYVEGEHFPPVGRLVPATDASSHCGIG